MKPFSSLLAFLFLLSHSVSAQEVWVPRPADGQELIADEDNEPALVAHSKDVKVQMGIGRQGDVFIVAIKLANKSQSTTVIPQSALVLPSRLKAYSLNELQEMTKQLAPLARVEQPNVEVPTIIIPVPGNDVVSRGINAYALGAQLRQLRTKEEVREYNLKVDQYNHWVTQENESRRKFQEWLENHKHWQTIALNGGEETKEYRYLFCKAEGFQANTLEVKIKLQETTIALSFEKP